MTLEGRVLEEHKAAEQREVALVTQRAEKAERERDAVRAQVQKDLASVAVTANQQFASFKERCEGLERTLGDAQQERDAAKSEVQRASARAGAANAEVQLTQRVVEEALQRLITLLQVEQFERERGVQDQVGRAAAARELLDSVQKLWQAGAGPAVLSELQGVVRRAGRPEPPSPKTNTSGDVATSPTTSRFAAPLLAAGPGFQAADPTRQSAAPELTTGGQASTLQSTPSVSNLE